MMNRDPPTGSYRDQRSSRSSSSSDDSEKSVGASAAGDPPGDVLSSEEQLLQEFHRVLVDDIRQEMDHLVVHDNGMSTTEQQEEDLPPSTTDNNNHIEDDNKNQTTPDPPTTAATLPTFNGAMSNADVRSCINNFGQNYSLVLVEGGDAGQDNSSRSTRSIWPIRVSPPRWEEDSGKDRGVQIVGETVTVQEPISVSLLHFDPHSKTILVAHDGKGTIAAAEGDASNGYYLRFNVGSSNEKGPVLLPEAPHSLYVWGQAVYVGLGNAVGWVNFADNKDAAPPVFVSVYQRQWQNKAYDMFTRKNDLLIAVDDMVFPFYADAFRIQSNGEPVHVEAWDLPNVVNGHYNMANVIGNDLLLTHNFYHRGGEGHNLTRICMDQMKDKRGRSEVSIGEINASGAYGGKPGPQVLTDHSDPLTEWTGMAVRQDRNEILLAAGTRGLLALPGDFQASTRAQKILVGEYGSVNSVVVASGETWATVVKTNSNCWTTDVVKLSSDNRIEQRVTLSGKLHLV